MTDEAARFFDAIAGRYERAYALSSEASRTRMVRVLRELPKPPARVLDLGIGTGRELTSLLDAGYAVTGMDVSRAMLDRCARRARPVPVVHADFWGPLPFEEASFDAVVGLHGTLAHPPYVDSVARLAVELARVVRPGGAFVAEVPSPAWLETQENVPPPADRRIVRTGPRTCTYEDSVTGASIAARVLTEEEWQAALEPAWRSRIEAIDESEWLVVGMRAR